MSQAELSEIPITERFSLKNKNFLITGGAQGISFFVAKAVAQLGGGVAVIDSRDKPDEEFEGFAKKYGVKTSYQKGDVTDQKSLEKAFDESVKAMGGQLHGGFTGAGIIIDQPLIDADWEMSEKVLKVNVLGTFWTAKLIAKHLVETKTPGSIVMVASLSGQGVHMPPQHVTIYNGTKGAVKGMVGPLATELGKYGIRVNSISPGAIETPLTDALKKTHPEIMEWFAKAAPVGRLGIPADLTPMVCYLLSDAGSFNTGADMVVTGGIHAGRTVGYGDHMSMSESGGRH